MARNAQRRKFVEEKVSEIKQRLAVVVPDHEITLCQVWTVDADGSPSETSTTFYGFAQTVSSTNTVFKWQFATETQTWHYIASIMLYGETLAAVNRNEAKRQA